jgi:hypothetical protein
MLSPNKTGPDCFLFRPLFAWRLLKGFQVARLLTTARKTIHEIARRKALCSCLSCEFVDRFSALLPANRIAEHIKNIFSDKGNAEHSSREKKTDRFAKNKTHEKLTAKILFGISLSVTKVTVFETSEGIGERSREALGENNGRAVCSCYDARR